MERTLVRLIEFDCTDMIGNPVKRSYEIYLGDFIQVYGSSANAYWRDRSDGIQGFETICQSAKYLVMSDGIYVGHWTIMDEIDEFIRLYMRGTNLTEVKV